MTPPLLLAAAAAVVAVAAPARRRLLLSRAKHPSFTGHVRIAKRIARQIPAHEHDDAGFFAADGAPQSIVETRRGAFERMGRLFADRFPKSRAMTAQAAEILSDLRFTSSYRVPFPFSRRVKETLGAGSFLAASAGATVTDLDGNVSHDLAGSYGVNLLGADAYKAFIAEAVSIAEPLGVVLGAYHPVVTDNAARLVALTGLDEVSFHMSGTEAVMQAVRLARYHTRRRRIVRFAGAYHGWWGDVQPGIGNPVPARDTLTLAEMSERTLAVLRSRRDIACVLVNPLQALHPNRAAPSDGTLVDSSRSAGVDMGAYGAWLRALATVCTARGIVLILDEVFTGFRLARGGAAERFGIAPDLVTYGKSLGGGFPVGVLVGRRELMRRFREDRPADICFARGTFNAHPYVMAAMNVFLRRIEEPDMAELYASLDGVWQARAAALNARLAGEELPVRVAALSSIWTTLYTRPCAYNWMLQFYLRAEGLALSWVGTGRILFPITLSDADFEAIATRFVAAAREMAADGWWWNDPDLTDRAIRRAMLRASIAARLGLGSRSAGDRAVDPLAAQKA